MTKMDPEKRLGHIIRLIANQPGITLSGLCKALDKIGSDVTRRTVAKDILQLKTEFQLLPDKPRLRQGYFLEGICSLSEHDVELILDALHVFGVRLNDAEAVNLMNRLSEQTHMSSSLHDGGGDIRGRSAARILRERDIYPRSKRGPDHQAILLEAVRSQQAVTMMYVTPRIGKPLQAKGYPLLLVFHERGWYCITRDLKSKTYQPRRLDRIRSCTISKSQPVNQSHNEDRVAAEFLMNCGWGMTFPQTMAELETGEQGPPLIVRFDSTVAPYILESFNRHPRGTVSPAKDGSGDALFKIRLSNPLEFLHWVRSFGPRAWIVSPESARQRERVEISRMAERYK